MFFFVPVILLFGVLVGIIVRIQSKSRQAMITMRLAKLTFLFICAFTIGDASAQAGLWEVTKVTVGEETMTPVAKWFDISEDGTVLGGNGGLINIRGTYTYDPETSEAFFSDQYGVPDEFGAFRLSFDDEKLIWRRTENGMDVIVSLKRVKTIPDGPWDKCVGDWSENDTDTRVSMWWDRRYTYSSDNSNYRGTWFINPHQPRLTLYRQDGQRDEWTISFPTDSTMSWSSEFGDERIFTRQAEH